MKKIAILLCAVSSVVAFAGSKPVGGGTGGTTNGTWLNGIWENGISNPGNGVKLNGEAAHATGFKAANAKVHHGKLFIRAK